MFNTTTALTALAALATAPILPETYSLICTVNQSSGFNWRAGQWVPVRFKAKSYLVTRQSTNICLSKKIEALRLDDTFSWRGACINLREIGEKYFASSSASCTEFYINRSGAWSTSISCYDSNLVAQFNPDGWFHLASIHGDLSSTPKSDYKDSQYVEIGKCSRTP